MSLLSRTVSSVGWTAGARVVQQVFHFGLSVLLMRLLGPNAFGLIGMVLVFSGFAAIFSELGFSAALVQKKELQEEHRSTAFWLNIGFALLLAGIIYGAAPFIADFYGEPGLEAITAWMALSFPLAALGMVPRSLLQKGMRFDILAKVETTSLILSGTAAAVIALSGGGIWSLVAQRLITSATHAALFLVCGRWRPRIICQRAAARDLFRYGSGLTGFRVVNYWARSADTLLIGKFLGAGPLGFYSRAYSLMLLPLTQVVNVIAPVMFPALSSIQDDKPRVRRSYLRVMRLLTFVTAPLMIGLAAVAEPFVQVCFGSAWIEVIPLIQILAFVGILQTICNPTGWIYQSQGRTDLMFYWGLGGSGALIAAIVIGLWLGGVQSVAWAYLIGNVIITLPCVYLPGRLIGMTLLDVEKSIRANLLCALAMGALVVGVGHWLPDTLAPAVRLGLQIITGLLSYAGLIWQFNDTIRAEAMELLRNRPGGRTPAPAPSAGASR